MDTTRNEILARLRSSVTDQLTSIESVTGLHVRFARLPVSSPVAATYAFDPHNSIPTVSLGSNWEDVDVAHELTHMQLELVEGYKVLAWRHAAKPGASLDAAMRTLRAFPDDEVVHARLVFAGFQLDGEVLRPQLFADRCTTVPKNLRCGRSLKNDGMAHLDRFGLGDLYRAMLFVQSQLIRVIYEHALSQERLNVLDDFLNAFRRFRPRQLRKAQQMLQVFETHDVQTIDGHAAILSKLAAMENMDQFMGASAFRRHNGAYVLPWP